MLRKILILLPIFVLAMQERADEDSIRFIFEPDSLFLHVGQSAEITIKMVTADDKLTGTPFLIYGQPRRSLETYPRISDSTGFVKVKVRPYKPGSLKLRTRSISIKREDRVFGELKITVKIEHAGKLTSVEIFTNLTNSVQTPNSIELSMIIVKLELT